MSPSPRTPALALAAGVAALLVTCGGDSPTGGTPPVTTPPVTVNPGPPPPPPPDPLPGAASCARIGEGARAYNCREDVPSFHEQVQAAIDELVREKPQLFDNTELGLRARSSGQFYVGVIQNLDRKGLCASFDGEEVGVKSEQSFSDQYHLLTTNFIVRQGTSSYQVTCFPAAHPTPAPGYAPSNGCTLPSSREITCGKESAAFYGDVDAAISQVAREHPQVFDLGDARGEGGYKIADPEGFKSRLFDAMRARGFCARHDGEEFVFKKGGNTFSEHYDLESSQGYVRRGEGTYASTCYPAAF
jgi:hypothetical protein